MNSLQPGNRTTPIAAYIAVRSNGPFNHVLRTSSVNAATRTSQPNSASGQGISSALLGTTTTVKALGSL